MKQLAIAKDLSLPIEFVTQKAAFLGRTGSGKTYAATKAAELMLDAGAQVIAIDPVGVWWGLRLEADGKTPSSFDLPVFGGLHGDIPIEPTSGVLLADLVVDRGISAILDVSQLESDKEKNRFASDFADRFFSRKKAAPSAVHLFVEECQEFCVPRDTEVLTPVGWQPIHRLRENDCVVAFHPESGTYRNEAIERVVVKQFTGQLTHLRTASLDCAVTPDHRVVMRRFQHDPKRYRLYPWTFCAAEKLPREFQVPSGEAPDGPGLDIPDDILRLVGWIVTEGAALSRVLIGYLGEEIHRIPRQFLMNCSRAQLSVLYEGLLEGDGTAKAGRWSRFYAGLNEGLADDFQELATRLGVRTVKKCVPQNGQWTVMISETRNHWVRYRGRRLPYSGIVYCLTVPSGAFVARRNGTVFVTGNCPQNPGRDENDMLHYFNRMIKLGRNFGIGVSLISQRPQEVNKKALNQTELMLAFQMTGPQERKAIKSWVSDKGAEEDVAEILPKLQVGECHVWSPQWLQISRTVKIAPKRTFNASSTPTVGGKAVEARPLGAIDLEKLQKAMASTIERAKDTDPKALRAEIARLKRELVTKPAQNGASARPIDREQVQRLVDAGVRKATDAFERQDRQFRQGLKREIDRLQRQFEPIATTIAALASAVAAEFKPIESATPGALLAPTEHRLNPPSPVVSRSGSSPEHRAGGHAGRDSRERPATPLVPDGEISGAKQKILNAIATLKHLGVDRPSLVQVALFVGVSHTTGSYKQNVRDLEAAELVARDRNDVTLTGYGRTYGIPDASRDPIEYWKQKLPGAQAKLLEKILDRYPELISREELAQQVGVSHTTGSFQQNLRDMRTYGIIEMHAGQAVASELLFP